MLAVCWHPSWGSSYSTTIWPICIVLPLLHCLVIRLQEWAQQKPAEIAWPFLTLLQKSYSITTACILFLQAVTKAHSCSRGRGIRLHLFIGQVSIYRHVLKLPQENRQLPWDGKVERVSTGLGQNLELTPNSMVGGQEGLPKINYI